MTTRPITIVIADTEKMLGEFKEGRVTSVWGSTCQTEETARGLDESREEERQSGQEANPGDHLHSWCPEDKGSVGARSEEWGE